MSYAQFTNSASLRSIEAQLTAFNSKLYHAGLKIMPKSTLADMNEKKDWRIYQDYAMVLVDRAKILYKDEYYRLGIDKMVYAFDSSTINLCLQLCPWAKFHHDKGAFKMHTLIDVKNNIPNFVLLTPGNVHDSQVMDDLPIEAGAYYLMDKGYVDFDRLFRIFQQQKAYFVTRAKDNMKYTVFEEREVDKQTGIISDESINLTGLFTAKKYPDLLRMVITCAPTFTSITSSTLAILLGKSPSMTALNVVGSESILANSLSLYCLAVALVVARKMYCSFFAGLPTC